MARILETQGEGRRTAIGALYERASSRPYHVSEATLEMLQAGGLTSEDVAPYADVLLQIWHTLRTKVEPRQQESASFEWLLDNDYHDARCEAELILDVLGYVPGDEVTSALREAAIRISSAPESLRGSFAAPTRGQARSGMDW